MTFNTKFSYYLSNAIGLVKIATLLFVIVTGFVVLGGNTKIENPTVNFQNSFQGTEAASAYGLTNALYRIIFSYGGYNNAFNVVNEVKVKLVATHHATVVPEANLFLTVEPRQVAPQVCISGSIHCLCALYVCQCGLFLRRQVHIEELELLGFSEFFLTSNTPQCPNTTSKIRVPQLRPCSSRPCLETAEQCVDSTS